MEILKYIFLPVIPVYIFTILLIIFTFLGFYLEEHREFENEEDN